MEQRLGSFIVEHPEDFVNMTTKKLAQRLEISEGSIIRFCQKFGFDGFTALKIGVARNIEAGHRFVLGDISIADGDAYSVVAQLFDATA